MSERYFMRSRSVFFSPAFVFLLLFFSVTAGAQEDRGVGSALRKLEVAGHLQKSGGGYTDMFLRLKDDRDFRGLARKHGIDDPAVWPSLRKRIVLQLADLQGDLGQAKSMMAVQDRRGGLENEVVSAEKTRAKGRQLRDRLVLQMDELRQTLRLMDEMESALQKVSREHALTGPITIENKAGQAFTGQALLIDGNDLIVKRGEAGYFRVPTALLNERTKYTVLDAVVADWEALPARTPEFDADGNAVLVAFDDARLFVDVETEGLALVPQPEEENALVPYAAALEAAREALSAGDREERVALEEKVATLEAALKRNQSRLSKIDWYASRLGIDVPESQAVALHTEPSAAEDLPSGETGDVSEAAPAGEVIIEID
jgi:hypothetical protein